MESRMKLLSSFGPNPRMVRMFCIEKGIDIETVEEDNKTILKLTVDETDKGKIIGKNGKIAKSIRNVLKLASTKDNNKYILEIT